MNDLISIMTPSLITATVIIISFWASKNAKSTKIPNGLLNAVEAMVEVTKNISGKISKSKFAKISLSLLVGIYLVVEVLTVTNSWSKLAALRHASPDQTTQKVKAPKPIKPPKAVVEKKSDEPKSVFVPYLRAGTADLNTTLALALISVIATQVIGVKFLGLGYFKKYINFKGPINAFVGLLEIISEISKIISFSFRLFGNIFAGEVLLAVIYYLLPVIVPIPFLGLEIFVGTIQAFVFATLSLVFMNLATQGHGEEHEEGLA